ncbi:hypothetical protein KY290_023946 [Solanum tuberosum]|uniref:Uncharacterized protein n=1 Tax=Solanum tuberosum TaxID=4113 RepID=A0ABQ7UPA2_SOLTU|nr:hypothetical protein KY284_022849 [Solanum tuberosum]KAH0677492.1 hypothetical protein KY285_025293 [Solanum tuberosum]KAH0753676.1 hypothetical protein KY290_023946 [Solanum tuberosum]
MQNELSISVDSHLAMLRLSSAADATTGKFSGDQSPLQQCHSYRSVKKIPPFSPEISTTTIAAAVETPATSCKKTTLYGGATTTTKGKRHSNCRFSSSLEEPFPKRTATVLPPIPTAADGGVGGSGDTYNINNSNHFQGFIKIPLQNNQESPVTPSPSPSPAKPPLAPPFPRPLYRTTSDPTGKSPKLPSHRTLTRTSSWSPNELNFNNGESPTTMKSPTHSAVARTASWSPNVQELGGSVNNGESPTTMDDEIDSGGGEALCEEAVWVERMGSCLILHFKCPCGKGYQILLCGNNCYYKLTNF